MKSRENAIFVRKQTTEMRENFTRNNTSKNNKIL